jgi:hypothetical protein
MWNPAEEYRIKKGERILVVNPINLSKVCFV